MKTETLEVEMPGPEALALNQIRAGAIPPTMPSNEPFTHERTLRNYGNVN